MTRARGAENTAATKRKEQKANARKKKKTKLDEEKFIS